MQTRRIGALAVAAVVVTGACSSAATTAPAAPAGSAAAPAASAAAPAGSSAASGKTITIGVDLPLSGGEFANGDPTKKGIQLAVDQANKAGGVGGYTIVLSIKDDAVNGVHNPQQGATNVQTLVADPSVIGIVGPFNSNVGAAEIPITNQAGLLQCSPANTNPGLTKPQYGALDIRKAFPNRINYIRVATTDDIQGLAGAEYAYTDLGKRRAYVVDDTETYGKGLADVFATQFAKLGGTVVKHDGAPATTTDYTPLLTAVQSQNPDVVYFGGVTATGGGLLRKQMAQVGMGSLAFGGGDGIVDGPGGVQGSFITVAGSAAANSFGTIAATHDIPNASAFSDAYKAAYGAEPGAYSASAYACTQVILQALAAVASTATSPAALREAVRAYATNPANKFTTQLGTISFDSNGDTSQHIISFYKTDMTAAGGKGDWVFVRQQDFGASQ
jgi:branched-chain amino acid transport system substrate-binding protein